jgi:hypothetical protein
VAVVGQFTALLSQLSAFEGLQIASREDNVLELYLDNKIKNTLFH